MRYFCLLWAFVVATGIAEAEAAPTSLALIYGEVDGAKPDGDAGLLGRIEKTGGTGSIRLALKDLAPPKFGQLLMATAQREAPIRLAGAGGSIGSIAVLYPDIGEPYRGVFSKIIEGIEENAQLRVTSYAVGNNFNTQMISDELRRQDIRVVIALGRNGLKAANTLDKEIGVLAGGVVSVPESDGRNNAILSLAPDPALLFARLKTLSPKTQRVFVVFDTRQNGWLIKLANDAARSQGLELVVHAASDLKGALPIYQNIFATADAKKDALWLPQDSTTVDESLVLPLVLQESWSRSIPVFSSNVSHVKRGALFALYPNNMELGRSLSASALGMANGNPAVRGISPLRNVLTAFNTRTASHLGLNPSTAQKKGFDLIFPEQ